MPIGIVHHGTTLGKTHRKIGRRIDGFEQNVQIIENRFKSLVAGRRYLTETARLFLNLELNITPVGVIRVAVSIYLVHCKRMERIGHV